MRFISLLVAALAAMPTALAQTTYTAHLRKTVAGKGVVVINQSEQIERLVNNTAPAAPSRPNAQKQNTAKEEHGEKSAAEKKTATHSENSNASGEKTNTAGRSHVNRTRHKERGYRICIYTGGNSRADKTKAAQMGQKCRAKFPELSTYTTFIAPRWVTHVGDFRTKQAAQKYVDLIRRAKISYEVRIVGSEVNLPDAQ